MKMLTKNNSRQDLEKIALDFIMHQQDEFSMKTIIMALRAICDEDIEMSVIDEIVFNAFDYCLTEGYIDVFDQFQYMVDPIKQAEYLDNCVENLEI